MANAARTLYLVGGTRPRPAAGYDSVHSVAKNPSELNESEGVKTQSAELIEWLQRSARGDEQAFAAFYDATSARVYGLVRRVVRDPSQAQEVAQEVYIDLWRQSARFDPARGSAMSWLLTMAHRRAVDRVRSAQSSTDRDERYAASTMEIPSDVVSETVALKLEAQRVRRALVDLTEVQREAVVLTYYGGYSHREVSDLLGLPLGTVKTRVRDGLIRLRDAMGVQ